MARRRSAMVGSAHPTTMLYLISPARRRASRPRAGAPVSDCGDLYHLRVALEQNPASQIDIVLKANSNVSSQQNAHGNHRQLRLADAQDGPKGYRAATGSSSSTDSPAFPQCPIARPCRTGQTAASSNSPWSIRSSACSCGPCRRPQSRGFTLISRIRRGAT